MVENYNILNININTVNINKIKKLVDCLIMDGKKGYITVTGVHGVMESMRKEQVKEAHNSSFLTIPDGMPLVWIGKSKGYEDISRCYGPDVMFSLMEHSEKKGYTHFFYGGAEGVAEELKVEMEERFQGINIVGTYCPPFRPLNKKEENELIEKINKLKPDFIWVGLSTPKQELFMEKYIDKFDTNVMLGVGAAFDFHSGRKDQAPNWIQKSGFEWFYRLCKEPKRLWKRYLKNNTLFIIYFILQILGIKKI